MIVLLIVTACATMCVTHNVHATAKSFEDIFNEANQLFYKQEFAQALEKYKEARAMDEGQASVHYNIGVTCFELRDFVAAEEALKQALRRNPRHSRAAMYLGHIARERKLNELAETYYKQALSYDPGLIDAVTPLCDLLKDRLHCEDALIYLRAAYEKNSNHIGLAFNLANTFNMADHTQEALELYLKLNEKHPNDSSINYNIAYTYKKLGRLLESLPYYEKALSLRPDHYEALFSRGLTYIMLGDWEKGWEGYEYRWKRDSQTLRNYTEPLWRGEPLEGKHIFVYAEQGLGDTFQFMRYLKILKEMGAYITFAPQNALRTLLKLCPYVDALIPHHERPAHFDYFIPLVSLPYVLQTRVDTVPVDIPYIYADPALVAYWHDQLAQDTNFKIGICWQGNSEYSTAFLRAAVASKSAPLKLFEPLTHIPGVSVYSLQRVTGVKQVEMMPSSMNLITFDEDFDNSHGRFMDTAAIMKNLDLVVTIDTSICHLAAGLGIPVWNLLPTPADWRWLHNQLYTPWYPNMRLFRQPEPGAWGALMDEVVRALKLYLAHHEPYAKKMPYTDPKEHILTLFSHLQAQRTLITDSSVRSLIDEALTKLEYELITHREPVC